MEPGQTELEKTKLEFPKNTEKTVVQELQEATPSEQASYIHIVLGENSSRGGIGCVEKQFSVYTEERGDSEFSWIQMVLDQIPLLQASLFHHNNDIMGWRTGDRILIDKNSLLEIKRV